MSTFYYLCFAIFVAQELRHDAVVDATVNANCQWVAAAITRGSLWYADENKRVLQWYRPSYQPSQEASTCYCNPLVGGPGNFSRIELTQGQQIRSNILCSSCIGVEVPVTDYSFCPDEPINGQSSQKFGPCDGITVYRCNCPTPAIPTVTIPTVPTVTIPIVTTPKVSFATTGVDPYNP